MIDVHQSAGWTVEFWRESKERITTISGYGKYCGFLKVRHPHTGPGTFDSPFFRKRNVEILSLTSFRLIQ